MSVADSRNPSGKASETFGRLPRRLADELYEGSLTHHGFTVISLFTILERDGEVTLTLAALKERLAWPYGESHLSKTLAKLRADGWIAYELSGQSRRIYKFRLVRGMIRLGHDSDTTRTRLGLKPPLPIRTPLGPVRDDDQAQTQSLEPAEGDRGFGQSESEAPLEGEWRREDYENSVISGEREPPEITGESTGHEPPVSSHPVGDPQDPEVKSKRSGDRLTIRPSFASTAEEEKEFDRLFGPLPPAVPEP